MTLSSHYIFTFSHFELGKGVVRNSHTKLYRNYNSLGDIANFKFSESLN